MFIPLDAFIEFPPYFFSCSNNNILNFPDDILSASYAAVNPANPAPTIIMS